MSSSLEPTGNGRRRQEGHSHCLEEETYWRWEASEGNWMEVACLLEEAWDLVMEGTCLMRE